MKGSLKALSLATALLVMGCGGSDDDFNIPIVPVGPPSAVNDNYAVFGNGQLNVPAPGVLANDTPNGASASVQTAPAQGTLTLNADGSFTYTPNAGVFNQTDSFVYRLTNSVGSADATVSITVGPQGAFVDNSAPAGGNGSEGQPFQSLAQAVAANGANPVTFVLFPGSGAYTESLTLQDGQALQSRPGGGLATISGQVTLNDGNTVKDLILNGNNTAINATNANGGTIDAVQITGASNKGIALLDATGTWTIRNGRVDNVANGTIDAITTAGTLDLTVSNCTFTGNTLDNIFPNPSGTAVMQLLYENNTVTGGGVAINGIAIRTGGTAQLTARILKNTISGCTNEGIFASISDSSLAKIRFEDNTTTGNQAGNGWNTGSSVAATFHAIFKRNTSDQFNIGQGAGSTFLVENLPDFNGLSGNVGTLNNTGAQSAPEGSLGIP